MLTSRYSSGPRVSVAKLFVCLSPLERHRLVAGSLALLIAGVLIYIAFRTGWNIAEYYTPFPIWDYWRVAEDLPALQSGHWGFLWRQHNDHRVVFPELVFMADMVLWHGLKILPLILSYLCYVGAWLLASLSVFRDRNLPRTTSAAICFLAGCMVCWHSVALVLAEPFLLQWTLMQAAAAAATVLLVSASKFDKWTSLVGSILAAVVANYSSGNGMLLWPLLWIIGVWLRLSWSKLLALAGAGLASAGCYFIGYQSSGSLNVALLAKHPLLTLGFFASYLSMPFGGLGATEGRAGLIAGFLCLGVTALCLVVCFWRRWLRESPAIILLSLIAFNVVTALMTAGGRMSLSDTTFGFAKAVRYLSVPQLNWGFVILLALWVAARAHARIIYPAVAMSVAVALFIYLARLEPWIRANADSFAEGQLAVLSFENRTVNRDLAFRRLFPDLNLLNLWAKRLEGAKKSIYYRDKGRWLGKPAHLFGPARPGIQGAIVTAVPMSSGIFVTGWVDDSALRKPVRLLVLADSDGTIRGFARRFPSGLPSAAQTEVVPSSLGFAGYLPRKMTGEEVHAFAIDPRKTGLMPLNLSLRVPNVTALSRSEAGTAVPGVTWEFSPSIVVRNLLGGDGVLDSPEGLPYSTYSGSDAITGSITSSVFARPSNGCLVIPILTGPSVPGLQARLEDASTGSIVEQFPLVARNEGWRYWRVAVDPSHQSLRLALEDRGNGWGQWIATATPLLCHSLQ